MKYCLLLMFVFEKIGDEVLFEIICMGEFYVFVVAFEREKDEWFFFVGACIVCVFCVVF